MKRSFIYTVTTRGHSRPREIRMVQANTFMDVIEFIEYRDIWYTPNGHGMNPWIHDDNTTSETIFASFTRILNGEMETITISEDNNVANLPV